MFVMAGTVIPRLPFLCLLAVAGVVEGVRYIRARRYAALGLAALLAAGIAVPSNLPLASEATVRAGSLYNIGRRCRTSPVASIRPSPTTGVRWTSITGRHDRQQPRGWPSSDGTARRQG